MGHRLSYYTIFSDELNSRGDSILFCTRTAQAFLLSKTLKNHIINGELDLLSPVIFDNLFTARGIVPDDEDELLTIRNENKSYIAESSSTELYTVIQPSAGCQLGCYYCGQTHTKDNLSDTNVELIVSRLKQKLLSGNYKSLHVGWFGAEPLMGLVQMRALSKRFKKLCLELQVAYTSKIVTNGLSLKPAIYKELVKDLNVRTIEVTLDGTAASHDKHRYLKDGGKSFDYIYGNLTGIFNLPEYETLGCPISIRCNVDTNNWADVSNLIEKLARDGFQKKLSYFYTMGIYSWGQNDAHKKSLSKEEFAEKEIDWLIELIQAGFKPKLLPSRQKQVCAAVNPNFEMYDALGNVFNCTEVSYSNSYVGTKYVLGNISDPDMISSDKLLIDWNDEIGNDDKFPCTKCRMLPVCGGACPKSWHEDMRACPSSKFNIKEKLALAYIVSKSDIVTPA